MEAASPCVRRNGQLLVSSDQTTRPAACLTRARRTPCPLVAPGFRRSPAAGTLVRAARVEASSEETSVNLTIDGRPVAAEPGATILQAARAAGIDVPTLCYHDRLEPISACRLCVVELRGQGRPGHGLRHAGRRRHGGAHGHGDAARHPPAQPGAAAQRPHLILHAAVPRRLSHSHQDPRLHRPHRAPRLRSRDAHVARGPALPRRARPRLPAALPRAPVAATSSTSPSPSAGCTASRRTRRAPRSRPASCCCPPRSSPRAAGASPSSAPARPASPPPSTPGSRATP